MTEKCSVADCPAPARTKGLCQKHYMHVRRHGDVNVTKPPGRNWKPSEPLSAAQIARTQFWETSPRSLARWANALRYEAYLRSLGKEGNLMEVLTIATRRNGGINFVRVEEMMSLRALMASDENNETSSSGS